MSDAECLCARCARHQKTCCQISEIYATPGDVSRIAAWTGRSDFFEFRQPVDEVYLDQDDDPEWRDQVFRSDGSRRVLKRQPGGDCTFLGPQGCGLPPEVRPLVCRLYPYSYTAAGIHHELSDGCPLQLLAPGQGLLQALEMNRTDAERWHRMLYDEIRQEPQPAGSSPDAV